jgi:hypothetical protein
MEIQLSKTGKNKGLYTAIVDKKDYERVNQFNWSVFNQDGILGASRHCKVTGKKLRIMLGKFILNTDKTVYHKNGNRLDFRRSNMYTSEKKPKHRKCTSKYFGVLLNTRKLKSKLVDGTIKERIYYYWISFICYDGKSKYLGTRTTELLAAQLYDRKALQIFGDKAVLNFPNQ